MNSTIIAGLSSGSVDASLTEVDACTKDSDKLRNGIVNVGPFGVFSLSDRPSIDQAEAPVFTQDIDAPVDFPTASISDLDSILDIGNALGWNDLFDTGLDFTSSGHDEPAYEDPLTMLARVANQPPELQSALHQSSDFSSLAGIAPVEPGRRDGALLHASTRTTDGELLSYGQILLKHFKDVIIPTYSPVPMNSRSPWEIMNCYAAVQTLADLTFLNVRNVKHANKANLYGALACSAYNIAKTRPDCASISSSKCQQIGDYASRSAKKHLQDSLRTETTGPQKARYKDQLMAINMLIGLATLLENRHDCRCYLIDAERLLRLRGLNKSVLSRRARLLHHVYTWLRIVGESTFVIHDYANSILLPRIESSLSKSRRSTNGTQEDSTADVPSHGHLDDFLRVDAHEGDSGTDSDEHKDDEIGIRDIHLEDMRPWSNTLYLQIYGIPETWLSLVSQTTRLANVIDVIDATGTVVSRSLNASLQRKSSMLETMICSMASKNGSLHPKDSLESTSGNSDAQKSVNASEAMHRAMNSALVIFFYRRIRNVHPWILQPHVHDVVEGLKEFDRRVAKDAHYTCGTVGTFWPAFMAGCEATAESTRTWLSSWLEKRAQDSPTTGNRSSIQIMSQVWRRRDAAIATEHSDEAPHEGRTRSQRKADMKCTWVHVLRDEKYWPMLY
ncbi:MAG: hypothetical protein Q9195_006163 [Heterodermia aff. obscurata]